MPDYYVQDYLEEGRLIRLLGYYLEPEEGVFRRYLWYF
ncbi:hypothetical protein HNQ57_003212 [Zhongshania antarctica]|uniref:Uncharacterized protein n=1 Tax=Zhongshania antarctica TaxID=641702 RepID=A0A840R6P4_9GAMM|nr:hypothetical protein [Zhongshania antarctica]